MKSVKYLYRELFCQQKICGIVFGICGALTVCGVLLIYAFAEPDVVPQMFFNPYSYFIMIVGGMTFPLVGFAYLNKRNSADIYHSIPASRLQLFLGTAGASCTWIMLLLVLTYVVSMIGYALMGIPFSFLQGLCEFLNMTAASLSVAAGTMIAVSISGSTLSALAASLVINYVPRLVMTAVSVNAVGSGLLCIDELGLLSPRYNLAYGTWLGLFFNGIFSSHSAAYSHMIDAWYPVGIPFLYTLLLAAVMAVLAAWLFIRRKSESAGSAAVSPIAQHIVRCGVASPFIIALMMCYDNYGYDFDESYFWIILLASLGVYVIYELISRRSIKKALKTVPMFAAMTVLLLIGGLAADSAGIAVSKRTVEPDEIKSVCFTGESEMYPMDNEYTRAEYGRLEFADPQIKELAANALKQTIDEDIYSYAEAFRTSTVELRVRYKTSTGSFSRYVEFSYADYIKLIALTSADDRVDEINTLFPTSEEAMCVKANCYNTSGAFTEEQIQSLWDMAVEEYLALSKEEKLTYHNLNSSNAYVYSQTLSSERVNTVVSSYDATAGWLSAIGVKSGKTYEVRLYLNAFFPKTIEQMFNYMESEEEIAEVAQIIMDQENYKVFEWQLICHAPDGTSITAYSPEILGWEDDFTEEDAEPFADSYLFFDEGEESLLYDMEYALENREQTEYKDYVAPDSAIREVGHFLIDGYYSRPDLTRGYYTLQLYHDDPETGNHRYRCINFTL